MYGIIQMFKIFSQFLEKFIKQPSVATDPFKQNANFLMFRLFLFNNLEHMNSFILSYKASFVD